MAGSLSSNGKDMDRIKGPWSPEEDATLKRLVEHHGARNWSLIGKSIAGRSGKSCRLRWCNQLSPEVQHRPFSKEEDEKIINAHKIHGNKWATIARSLNGRTDNAIKNHWNSTLKRKCAETIGTTELPRQVKRANNGSGGNGCGVFFCLSPETQSGSDVSDSGMSCPPQTQTQMVVFRPVASPVATTPTNLEAVSSSNEQATSLNLDLSLSGLQSADSDVSVSAAKPSLELASSRPGSGNLSSFFPSPPSPPTPSHKQFPLWPEHFPMLQEMIAVEVRKYMKTVYPNGSGSDPFGIVPVPEVAIKSMGVPKLE